MTIFVTGLESSGQKWLRSCLNQHPDLTTIGDSAPRGWARYGGRGYEELPTPYPDALVVIVRDTSCHTSSVSKLGYNLGAEGLFTDEESKKHILKQVNQMRAMRLPVVFVSYEGLIEYEQAMFNWLFDELGVKHHIIQTKYNDGNKKYFKGD